MTNHVEIVNSIDAAIKRHGADIPSLQREVAGFVDQVGEQAVLDALIQCAAIAYLRATRLPS